MAISDRAWKEAQAYEIKYTFKYQWKKEWKNLYRNHLKTFFGVDGQFPESIVVDVGCGPIGIVSVIEAKKKIGIDPLIDEYNKIYKDRQTDVEYINSKAEDIPLPDSYADIVFCVNTLNHVQDPEKVLGQIARILKPTGTLYFDVHINPRNIGHPHVFTKKHTHALLKKHFKIKKTMEVNKTRSIAYNVYCSCGKKLLLSQQFICPKCGKGAPQTIKGPRIYISKTKVLGAICLSLKS